MLKEIKGLEYTMEVIRVLHNHPGEYNSKNLYNLMISDSKLEVSLNYLQKILQRLVKTDILNSSDSGYILSRDINEITIDMLLDFCELPEEDSPVFELCKKLKSSVSLISVSEVYDF